MSSVVDWSKMNTELLDLIIKRLDLIEFIRAGAVCQSWRSTMKTCSPPKSPTPWLICSSPHQPDFRYVSNLVADPKSVYKFSLPNLKYHYIVGSSHGFILSVDEICQIHATNPITGSHRLLPAVTTLPCFEGAVRDPITNMISDYFIQDSPVRLYPPPDFDVHHVQKHFYHKVALFPSSSSAGLISVLIHSFDQELAFARQSDESWTYIRSPSLDNFDDVLFYKGLLYAVNFEGGLLAIDILNYSASSQPVINQDGWVAGINCFPHKNYLVQSLCGSDLFLIARFMKEMVGDAPLQTDSFKIYKLNQDCYQWSEVSNFGTEPVVVFVGISPSVMLLSKDVPNVAVNKGDCIYFTDYDLSLSRLTKELDIGIFYMEDNEIVPLDISDHPHQFNYPPPLWFTPVNI